MTSTQEQLREVVRRKYAGIARDSKRGCCSGNEPAAEYGAIGDSYAGVSGYMAEADLGLGCGLPVEHAGLRVGQTVLDLGSGAGLDAFVARSEVGEAGHVIGVDMTAEMVARARENARRSGFENVEFRLGEIEHLPVTSSSIDVVISNCVLNLVPDKERAFAEIHRVLKPGGHFCISDVVSVRPLPAWLTEIAEAYAGCVSGAIPKQDYLRMLGSAGFLDIEVAKEHRIEVPASLMARYLSKEQLAQIAEQDLHVLSVTVTARKQ